MPHRSPNKTGSVSGKAAGVSVSKAVASKSSSNDTPTKNGTPMKQKSKKKQNRRKREEPLFAFDTALEEYNWGRPKRRIKAISRFDPTIKEKQSDCKIGHGFACPQCDSINTYDSRVCYQCQLECCYEAGVGVVVLQDRRISYRPASPPEKKKAKGEKKKKKKSNATVGRPRKSPKEKSLHVARNNEGNSNSSKNNNVPSKSLNNDDGVNTDNNHDIQSTSFNDDGKSVRKNNIFANLKEKLKVASQSNTEESQQGQASRLQEATVEWTESTIAASKDGAYSTTANNPISEDDTQSSEVSATITDPPPPEDDINCCQELKQQLSTLQLNYDSILSDAVKAETDFRDVINTLEAAILQRNKDADDFSKTIASSSSRIAEIKERVGSLTSGRDDFVKNVEAKGLPPVPKDSPNYSTRIDELHTKLLQMWTDCDAAKERVKDLMSGSEVAKREKEKAAHDLEEMEIKHGETFTQCYKEIESFKQDLSEATAKISTMATEKAELVEKVSSTLIHVSRVRTSAETQTMKISELESSIESLTAAKDDLELQLVEERVSNQTLRQQLANVQVANQFSEG